MGSSQSKEEIIVAGNSGGQTNSISLGTLSVKNVIEILVIMLAAVVIMLYCYGKCKKRFEKKIRAEIRASQDIA